EGCDVEQQDVFDLALDNGRLDGGAYCHHFVWVDGHVRFPAACHTAYQGLHGGNPRRPTYQNDLINVVSRDFGVCHSLLDRPQAALDEIGSDLVERRPHEIDV